MLSILYLFAMFAGPVGADFETREGCTPRDGDAEYSGWEEC